MLLYKGKYNLAKVFIDSIDEETVKQIYQFLNHPAFQNSQIRIMPDCHAGKGAVVGFTMTLNDYIIPNIVGVDIGCGMGMVSLGNIDIDLKSLDNFIHENIPAGFAINENIKFWKSLSMIFDWKEIGQCIKVSSKVGQTVDAEKSLGSLGGGNHFIEIDADDEGNKYLIVHSGSRNFGLKVCEYHQKKAKTLMNEMFIGDAYKNLEFLPINNGGKDYLEDMIYAQIYAEYNRKIILTKIMNFFFHKTDFQITNCIHNYIDINQKIIRKGAISAQQGEEVIIPLNMRDGVILGIGKGNKDWNFSAPHGAGRILSRKKAKEIINIEDYKNTMSDVYTSCVNESTIDESPFAYKDKQLIIDSIQDTIEIVKMIKPVYNFKAGGDE